MSSAIAEKFRALAPTHHAFDGGAHLFRQDDPVRALHLIEAGEVHLIRHQTGGMPLTLQRAGPGAVLAEASLHAARYHCDAVAVRPARTLAVGKAALGAALATDAAFAEAWSALLSREIQATRMRAEILSLRTVAERLDAWLAVNDQSLPDRGLWKSLAGEIGTSPEALYRELSRRRGAGNGPERT